MKLTTLLLQGIATVSIALSSAQLFAGESPYNISLSSVAKINYEPFSGLPSMEVLNIALELSSSASTDIQAAREANQGRRLRLTIKTINNGDFIAQGVFGKLPVEISQSGNASGFGSSSNEVFKDISLGNLDAQQLEFKLSIPPSIYADPGLFLLPLRVELVDQLTQEVLDESLVEVQAEVSVSLQSNIAGGSRNQNPNSRFAIVDFGVLESGESEQLSLQIRGNSSANITLTSENRGKLKHTEDFSLAIDYTLSLDGKSSTLENPLTLVRSVDRNIRGSSFPINMVIGNVRNAFSGTYRDIITVEVRPTVK